MKKETTANKENRMVNVQVRMDSELKRSFENTCAEFGMNISTAFTVFAKTVVRQKRIPFEITAQDDFYNPYNMEILRKSLKEFEDGKGFERDLIEV